MSELRAILAGLWAERGRVGLVAAGVLWGTLGMGVLLAFGRAMSAATTETADTFGSDLLRVRGAATSRPFEGLPAGRAVRPRPADVAALSGLPGVRGVCHELSARLPVSAGDVRRNATVAGVSHGFGSLRNHRARPGGRFLNRRDSDLHRRVAFLGERLARWLFGDEDPVGRTVEMDGVPLTVVGVGPERIAFSNYDGPDSEKLVVPGTTFQDLRGWEFVSFAWVGLEPGADPERVLSEVRRVLGARLRFDPRDDAALDVIDYLALRAMVDGILDGNRVFTFVVGVLGLLVSVVGVANVMLALVEERTRELGVQLALGAPPRLLALERLVEGVLVTTLGGLAGLLACAALLAALGTIELPDEVLAYLGRPRLDAPLAAGVLAVLVGAGALAGWVPARSALRLDPAEVLREE